MKLGVVTIWCTIDVEHATALPSFFVRHRRAALHSSDGSSPHATGLTSTMSCSGDRSSPSRFRRSRGVLSTATSSSDPFVTTDLLKTPLPSIMMSTRCIAALSVLRCRCKTMPASAPAADRALPPVDAPPLSSPKTILRTTLSSPCTLRMASECARGVALRETSASDDEGSERTSLHSTSNPLPTPSTRTVMLTPSTGVMHTCSPSESELCIWRAKGSMPQPHRRLPSTPSSLPSARGGPRAKELQPRPGGWGPCRRAGRRVGAGARPRTGQPRLSSFNCWHNDK
mmetsp:Transcript_12023/g.29404  ORF Transcript_12023/g.29404 Transcript_12023/m.29404 type:complete len:285 (-) Transcript_12023:14-868(-)